MIIDSFFTKKLQKDAELYVLFSITTRNPFIICDPESFDDAVLVFNNANSAKSAAKKYIEQGYAVSYLKLPSAKIIKYLESLYAFGVNSIVYNDGEAVSIPLENVVKKPEFEKLKNDKVPRINPELQLSAIYFLQEVRRKKQRNQEESRRLVEMEEEMAVNLFRSRFIIALDITGTDMKLVPPETAEVAKGRKLVTVKAKDGNMYLPCFSDVNEFTKFSVAKRKGKFHLVPIPYEKLSVICKETKGVVVNPMGFNLLLKKESMERLINLYGSKAYT